MTPADSNQFLTRMISRDSSYKSLHLEDPGNVAIVFRVTAAQNNQVIIVRQFRVDLQLDRIKEVDLRVWGSSTYNIAECFPEVVPVSFRLVIVLQDSDLKRLGHVETRGTICNF